MTPVLIDLETRSAAELRNVGGWNYAADGSTRLLTAAWTPDLGATYHVWLPGILPDARLPPAFSTQCDIHLSKVYVHTGPDVPDALRALTDRVWAGHNAMGFDKPVWAALYPHCQPVDWLDTMHMALSIGLPGGIDAIGKLLWGTGKYKDGKKIMLKAARCTRELCEPCNVEPITQVLIGSYNVQDVKLMADAWPIYKRECRETPTEASVRRASDAMNARGAKIDRGLVKALISLADESKGKAVERISAMTDGDLGSLQALQSRTLVFKWLDKMGIDLGKSLRKQIVAQYIDEYADEVEEVDWEDDETVPTNLARVVKVLELRMQALRITGGKLDAALWAMGSDHCVRGMFAYHGAHTGRWAGRRIQLQNLPRPKEGVDVWKTLDLYEREGRLTYDAVTALLPLNKRDAKGKLLYPYLSADDTASAMIRMIVEPYAGTTLATADLSQIEARILAWLAGEDWLMEAFWDGADPYLLMAEKIAGPSSGWPEYRDPVTDAVLKPKKHPYRQYIGKIPELAAGYQMSGGRLAVYAAQMGIQMEDYGFTPDEVVWAYRRSHPAIAGREAGEYNGRPYFRGGFWDQLNDAAIAALRDGVTVSVGRIAFAKEGRHLLMILPSGRRITYRNAELREKDFYGKPVLAVYYTHPRYGPKSMYGGAFAENAVQAVARDVTANGAAVSEYRGHPVILTCHDELGACIGGGVPGVSHPGRVHTQFHNFMEGITTCPDWLTRFPLDAEGGIAPRYSKSPPPGCSDMVYRNGVKR